MAFSRPNVKFQKRLHPNSDCCCVPLCTVSGKYNSAVSFHRFPKNESMRKIWESKVRRNNLQIGRHTAVCSRHFLKTDIIDGGRRRLKEGAVPLLFPWNDYSLPPARPSVWERTQRPVSPPKEDKMDVDLLLQCHDYDAKPEPSALDMALEKKDQVIAELTRKLEDITLQQVFGLQRFAGSDDDIRFYTRFASYTHFMYFWRLIEPATRKIVRVTQRSLVQLHTEPSKYSDLTFNRTQMCRPARCLQPIDELFLLLMYLSLGLNQKDLGHRFNVHQSTVSRIINTWVHFLYSVLGAICIWLSPEEIKADMPQVFGKYSDTQVIIDRTELKCQTPSSLHLQSEMFSQYKSHTTMKGMLGIAPNGAVTFVSSLFSGSVSDKELFQRSGIIPLLDKDMAVMVDQGFTIDDLVPCKVYRPQFLNKRGQFSGSEVHTTKEIARLRVHVEKVNRRIKENKLFESVIPLATTGSVNQLFAVASLLSNYQNKPLVKSWVKL